MQIKGVTFALDRTKMKTVTDGAVNAGLNRAAAVAVRSIKQSFGKRGKFRPSAPGTPPNRNRGLLYNSISSTKAKDKVLFVYSSGVAYAKKHEQPPGTNGTIFGKDRWLTIPLNDEAARMRERTRSLHFLPLFLVKTKSNRVILMDGRNKRSKVKSLRPMFLLKRSVTLPPRPFLAPAFKNPAVVADMVAEFCRGSKMYLLGTLS